jgi:hypothetical protein
MSAMSATRKGRNGAPRPNHKPVPPVYVPAYTRHMDMLNAHRAVIGGDPTPTEVVVARALDAIVEVQVLCDDTRENDDAVWYWTNPGRALYEHQPGVRVRRLQVLHAHRMYLAERLVEARRHALDWGLRMDEAARADPVGVRNTRLTLSDMVDGGGEEEE